MFIAKTHPLKCSSLREERKLFPASAQSCCAPTEREINSGTSGYKHLAPLGRNPCRARRRSVFNHSVPRLSANVHTLACDAVLNMPG